MVFYDFSTCAGKNFPDTRAFDFRKSNKISLLSSHYCNDVTIRKVTHALFQIPKWFNLKLILPQHYFSACSVTWIMQVILPSRYFRNYFSIQISVSRWYMDATRTEYSLWYFISQCALDVLSRQDHFYFTKQVIIGNAMCFTDPDE